MLARRDETGITARLGRNDGPGTLGRCQNLNQIAVSSEAHGGEFFREPSLQTLNDLGAFVAIVRGGRLCFGAQGVPADRKDDQDRGSRGNTGSHDKLLSQKKFFSREKGHPHPLLESLSRKPEAALLDVKFQRFDDVQGRSSIAGQYIYITNFVKYISYMFQYVDVSTLFF
jgi:hypothetical protein